MKLIVEPRDGVGPLLAALKAAKKSVDIAIFRFDRRDVEAALKAIAEKGIKVNALIAHTNRGGEKKLRELESRFLDAGITVSRSADDLVRYHDKYILIDGRVLLLLSFNFTRLDIDRSRGFGIVTRNAGLVREAAKLFEADSSRTPYAPGNSSLVVSPENSRKVLGAFLKRARKQLLIYDPKISDKEMLHILEERAKAGVEVQIIGKVQGTRQLDARKLAGTRLHTRTIIRDRRQAFVGSQSLRLLELDSRRELGLIVNDVRTVKRLADTFEADWDAAAGKEKPASAKEATREEAGRDVAAAQERKNGNSQSPEQVTRALAKELDPLTSTVKKVVRKVVSKVGEDVLADKEVQVKMKKIVKSAVKTAVKEAVRESGKDARAS